MPTLREKQVNRETGTTEELAEVECKNWCRWIIEASVTVMLCKQLGHRWRHQAARVNGVKDNIAIKEVHDDGEVEGEMDVKENKLKEHISKHSTA